MRNTKVSYYYRDASNYKQFHKVVVAGELTDDQQQQIWQSLSTDTDNGFIPEQVGLDPLQTLFDDDFTEDDHPWHTLEAVESTDEPTTLDKTAQELLTDFVNAAGQWDDSGSFI